MKQRYLVGVGLIVVVLVAGVFARSFLGAPNAASEPILGGGSLLIAHTGHDPLVVDLANRRVALRLANAGRTVRSEAGADDVVMVPSPMGTYLVNRSDGSYNLLGRDNLVVQAAGGVGLPEVAGADVAVDATRFGDGLVLRRRAAGATEVWFVTDRTIRTGAPGRTVVPRAYSRFEGRPADGTNAVEGDDGALWTTTGDPGATVLQRLSLPADDQGAPFDALTGPAPVPDGTVLVPTDGAVVGLAPGSTSFTYVRTSAPTEVRTVPIDGLGPIAQVLPVASPVPTTGRDDATPGGGAWFLTRTDGDDGGWAFVGVSPDGAVRGPFRFDVLNGTGDTLPALAPPVVVGTRATTISRADGSVASIDLEDGSAHRPEGADRYPVDAAESLADGFADATVVAIDGFVVANAPRAANALLLPDGEPAVVIRKSSDLAIDPSAPPNPDIEATADDAAPTEAPVEDAPTTSAPPSREQPPVTISDAVSCEDTSQTPRKPQIVSAVPSTTSVALSWSYPTLSTDDCQPGSYIVEGHNTDRADDLVEPVRVSASAQTSFTFTGLRPNRTYEFTVTAVIKDLRTPSDPLQSRTATTGPDPARDIVVDASAPGGWKVRWGSCTGKECDVAAAYWDVAWALCGPGFLDGRNVEEFLPSGQRQFDLRLDDHPELVGRKLRFTVDAVSEDGTRTPVADDDCTEGWRPAAVDKVVLVPSSRVQPDGTVAVLVDIGSTPDKLQVYGTAEPRFTYRVDGHSVGPTAAESGTVTGLPPGVEHQVEVVIQSHTASATTPPVRVPRSFLPWPAMSAEIRLDASRPDNRATLTVTLGNLPAVPLDARVEVRCRKALVQGSTVSADNPEVVFEVDLSTDLGPSCDTVVNLTQTENPPRYDGSPPPIVANHLTIEPLVPPVLDTRWRLEQGHFGGAVLDITGDIPQRGRDWKLTTNRGCGQNPTALEPGRLRVSLSQDCFDVFGPRLQLHWIYLSTEEVIDVPLDGSPPTTTTTTTTTATSTTTTRPTSTTTTPPTTRKGAPTPTVPAGGDPAPGPGPLVPIGGSAAGALVLAVLELRRRDHRTTVHPDPTEEPR